mgnify:CR=1 FL=1
MANLQINGWVIATYYAWGIKRSVINGIRFKRTIL